MKKILLGSTVLVGAVALFAGASFAAETPKVTIGGTVDFQFGHTNEKQSNSSIPDREQNSSFRNESEINVKIDAKTDSGLGYGGLIDLVTSGTNDADNAGGNSGANGSQTAHGYVYVDGAWGRVQGGPDIGVTNTMKVDASTIARATGGIDGDFNYFLGGTTQVIATPDLVLDYGAGAYGDESKESNNKISYYTPRFAGVQAGVSFVENSQSADRGITTLRTDGLSGTAKNIFLGALNYEGKFSGVDIAAAATGEYGSSELSTDNDLRTYQVGAKLGYQGFSIAGSYGNWGDSLRAKSVGSDSNNKFWTAGGAYEYGPFGASVTYLDSTYDTGASGENKFQNLSLGTDYKLAPGLTPYLEVNFVTVDAPLGADDNKATVIIAGTQLSF